MHSRVSTRKGLQKPDGTRIHPKNPQLGESINSISTTEEEGTRSRSINTDENYKVYAAYTACKITSTWELVTNAQTTSTWGWNPIINNNNISYLYRITFSVKMLLLSLMVQMISTWGWTPIIIYHIYTR